MASPVQGFDLGDWLALIVTSVLSGLGAAMAWFRIAVQKVYTRMDNMEAVMTMHKEKQAAHDTDLAVTKTNQEHLTKRLEEIRETTQNTDKKVDNLAETVTEVLTTVKKNGGK